MVAIDILIEYLLRDITVLVNGYMILVPRSVMIVGFSQETFDATVLLTLPLIA